MIVARSIVAAAFPALTFPFFTVFTFFSDFLAISTSFEPIVHQTQFITSIRTTLFHFPQSCPIVSIPASPRPAVASLTERNIAISVPTQSLPAQPNEPGVDESLKADCYPATVMPGQTRLFLDFCAGALGAFLPLDEISQAPPPRPAHWAELVHLVAEQNRSSTAEDSLAALAQGAGTVLTGHPGGPFG